MKPHVQAHVPELDGVRGLAVLLVILFHSALITPEGWASKLVHKLSLIGWIGVDLFFVLSGFLITRNLLSQKGSENFFSNFYMRRVLRLFPLYYLFLLLFLVIFPQGVQFGFTYWTFLSNILIGRLGFFQSPILDITWSLAVEEQFYLLWPLLIFVLSPSQLRKTTIFLFFLALFSRLSFYFMEVTPLKTYVLLPCRLDSLSAGAFLACWDKKISIRRAQQIFGAFGLSTMAIFLFGFSFLDDLMRTLGYSVNALFATALVVLILISEKSFLRSFFRGSFLRQCGNYSYAMYLFHVPVIQLLFSQFKKLSVNNLDHPAINLLSQLGFFAVSILSTFVLAAILYHAFEKHFLKLKKLFVSAPTSDFSYPSALN